MAHGLPFPYRSNSHEAYTRAGTPYAQFTVEHFTPLFVTLGPATDPTGPVTTAVDGFAIGLAKRSFQSV